MDPSYKAVTSHTLWFRLSRPAASADQAVTATTDELKGQRVHATLARRSALRLASAVAEREACAALRVAFEVRERARYDQSNEQEHRTPFGSGMVRAPRAYSGRAFPLLRGGGRRGRHLRRALRGALLLRLRVRFGIPLLEVRERIARLLRGQYPRRTLRGGRTRVRLAKVRAYDLAANAERSSKFLRAERLDRSHCNHLTFGVRVHRTRIPRGISTAVLSLMRTIHGRRAVKRTRVGCGIGGAGCGGLHAYRVAHAAYATQAYGTKTRPKARRTYVRCVRVRALPRRCLCKHMFDPPRRPPACARRVFASASR